MGDLGKASLIPSILDQLLELVMKDMMYFFGDKQQTTQGARQRAITWDILDQRQRQHLELAARLLACAQQEFLCKAQWDTVDDPKEALLSSLQIRGPGEDEWIEQETIGPKDCPTATFSDSPWMKYVLLCLASEVDWQGFVDRQPGMNEGPDSAPGLSPPGRDLHAKFPFLQRIMGTARGSSAQTLSYLPVIGACAELFPAGQCWTSNIFEGWKSLVPKDPISHDVMICQCCTVDDLSLLVLLLASFLEEQGGPLGDLKIQLWIIVALIKLTEPTALFYRHARATMTHLHLSPLAVSWKLVWQVLFRLDLRYHDSTKSTATLTLGELVLVLVRNIVQHKCTDPALWKLDSFKDKQSSFLYQQQSLLWNLHVFRNASSISSTVPFELVSWVCQNVGLSETGADQIDPAPMRLLVEGGKASTCQGRFQGRRQRLISVALATMECYLRNEQSTSHQMVQTTTTTVITLMRGRMPSPMIIHGLRGSHQKHNDGKYVYGSNDPLRCTDTLPSLLKLDENLDWRELCTEILWRDDDCLTPPTSETFVAGFDVVSQVASLYRSSAENGETLKSVDFVSDAELSELAHFVRLSIENRLFPRSDEFSQTGDVEMQDSHLSDSERNLSLAPRSLALKVYFSFNLVTLQQDDPGILCEIADQLSKCFHSLQLESPTQFRRSMSNLCQISGSLLELLSVFPKQIHLPAVQSLPEACRSMLRIYMKRLSDGREFIAGAKGKLDSRKRVGDVDGFMEEDEEIVHKLPVSNQAKPRTSARRSMSESSSDDESQERNRRKRKRSLSLGPNGPNTSTRNDARAPKIPDIKTAEAVCRFLLTLEPSFENCELVCRALLGADHDLDPFDLNGDVDLRGAVACIEFLTAPKVLLHRLARSRVSRDEDSAMATANEPVISLLHKVLDLIRVNASPLSLPSNNGYEDVASVQCAKVDRSGPPLLEGDLDILVNLLLFKDGIGNRPFLRATRMSAGASAFHEAGGDFHKVFDKHFTGLVKLAMTDSNIFVRRLGYGGVYAAVAHLDEQRVLTAVRKLIAPISQSPDPAERLKQFEEWFRQVGCSNRVDEELMDWCEVMEADSICCKAVIAAAVPSSSSFLDSIFEISMIPLGRPDLEFVCLQGLEKVARLRNYGTVECMMASESAAILHRWVESQHDSLPLLLTSPAIVRRKAQSTGARCWYGNEDIDFESLKVESLHNFVSKNKHLLVPFALFQSVSSLPQSELADECDTMTALAFLATNPKLRLLSSMLCVEDEVGEAEIRRGIGGLVRKFVPDIKAFCYPMLQSGEQRHNQVADATVMILKSIVSIEDIEARTKKKARILVRRIIDLVTLSEFLPSLIPTMQMAYVDAVVLAIQEVSTSAATKGDKLRNVGTNAIAGLIRSFAQLDDALVASHKRAVWGAVSVQSELIRGQIGNKEEKQTCVGFCIHILTEVILKPKFSQLRPEALSLLKQLLQTDVAAENDLELQTEVGGQIKRLVGACFHVHEGCQQRLLELHRKQSQKTCRTLRQSCGLAFLSGSNMGSDVWGWDESAGDDADRFGAMIGQETVCVDEEDQRTIVGTYDVLKWVFDHSERLALDPLAFVPIAPPYGISSKDLDLLASMNDSFSVQLLALRHLEKPGLSWTQTRPSVAAMAAELAAKLNNRQSWITTNVDRGSVARGGSVFNALNIDQRLIYALLIQLESGLGDIGEPVDPGSNECLEGLIKCFSLMCNAPCPEVLRIAASRCLGKLKPEVVPWKHDPNASGTPVSLIKDVADDGEVLASVQSQCLEALAGCLRSADPIVAEIASETLEVLLSTKSGRHALNLIDSVSMQYQLNPFSSPSTSKDSRANNVILSNHQLKSLGLKAGMPEETMADSHWCWNDELWLCFESDGVSFEEWVCTLTSTLIACCFASREDGKVVQRDVDGEFFWICQKICAFEHNIASTIFPFAILYLLESTGSEERGNFNLLITKSLSTMLGRATSDEMKVESESGRKALLLAIDTVDLLRKVSQARFLSRKHARNTIKIANRQSPPKSKNGSTNYNAGIPKCTPWEGVPFGVMVKLDGLMVAEVCIKVRRYASALFFLELHLNASFGKVGGLFDEFAHSIFDGTSYQRPALDISGILGGNTPLALGAEDTTASILKVMSVVAGCYKFMDENDGLEAVETQRAAIEFGDFGWNTIQANQLRSDPIGLLRSLNVESSIGAKEEALLVAGSMETLEFHALLRSYIDGVLSEGAAVKTMDDREIHRLMEKWNENRLRGKSWELLNPQNFQTVVSTGLSQDEGGSLYRTRDSYQVGSSHSNGFFGSISSALDSFQSDDVTSCRTHLNESRLDVILEVSRTGGLESSVSGMAEVVDKLRVLESLERVLAIDVSMDEPNAKFASTFEVMANHLSESPITTESNMGDSTISFMWLSELGISAAYVKKCSCGSPHRLEAFQSLVSQMCVSAVRARELGRPYVAAEAIQRLHRLLATHGQIQEDTHDQILLIRLEESKILESQGDFKSAIRKSQQIVDQLLQRENATGALELQMQYILADAQLSCGSWLTKYKVRQTSSVLEGYLRPGTDRAKRIYQSHRSSENADRTAQASFALGQIVTNLHQALVSRVRSPEWRQSSSTDHHTSELERCEPLLKEAEKKRNKTKKGTKSFDESVRKYDELYVYCEQLRKDLRRTSEERLSVIDSMHQYLRLAVESYTTALALASTGSQEDFSRAVSELMSLWFDNSKTLDDNVVDINSMMQTAFAEIPTFRFVPLTNQLFSRIEKSDASSSQSGDFQSVLQALVFKMCSDHPYHCIVPLLALANGKKVGSGVSGRHASAYIENVGNSKVAPANAIVSRLEKEAATYVSGLLQSYALLTDSYIELAGADTSAFQKKTTKDISFSKVFSVSSKALDRCLGRGSSMVQYPPAVFTSLPTLQASTEYGDGLEDPIGGERVQGFKPVFNVTETGLHRPKIVICVGTKGGEYRQLVKGEDEIRQDAIMSQVFNFVNGLMLRRRSTSERKTGSKPFPHRLRMATYNVVPLSPASGVLEWVEDTTAFGDVVMGRGSRSTDVGLHARYYPNEWNFLLCRLHFRDAPISQKRETFDVVCRHFSPSFRFFFVERFGHDMMAWHAARMRYTRSVAVSSMVGHVLGIGDRHTSNILIHTKTGEVVQIDFGIVFEQGKVSRSYGVVLIGCSLSSFSKQPL